MGARHRGPDGLKNGLAAEHRGPSGWKQQLLVGDVERARHHRAPAGLEIDRDLGVTKADIEPADRPEFGAEIDDAIAAVGQRLAMVAARCGSARMFKAANAIP
jgi:hypothetical protein